MSELREERRPAPGVLVVRGPNAEAAQRLMDRHARSFAPAARFMPRHERDDIARLYAICRTADDLADEAPPDVGRVRLDAIRADLYNESTRDRIAFEAQSLFNETPAGLDAFGRLLDGLRRDLDPLCLEDDADLDRYADAVAGTVGEMVCALFDIPSVHRPQAIALGRAMQFTNIARDVREDAVRGRRYLPATRCPATPAEIAGREPGAVDAAASATRAILDRADGLYRDGRAGLIALPLRLRLAVAVAARLYQGIGGVIRRQQANPHAPRAVVPVWRKIGLALVGITDALFARRHASR
ncbi:phytoene/squalene synthase family protein [Salinisphaera sp.]|uniref:phytoene/squalene synthase family protein n=1 Tax=Salinisphaera sp. TaxID=1914330 RepID=UPI0025E26491|nr:phytoene/squalene synthase family protein [Salinisphaera sp.]